MNFSKTALIPFYKSKLTKERHALFPQLWKKSVSQLYKKITEQKTEWMRHNAIGHNKKV